MFAPDPPPLEPSGGCGGLFFPRTSSRGALRFLQISINESASAATKERAKVPEWARSLEAAQSSVARVPRLVAGLQGEFNFCEEQSKIPRESPPRAAQFIRESHPSKTPAFRE